MAAASRPQHDIRVWSAIDRLLILMIQHKPLIIDGVEYWFLDLTLVDMPGNSGGVQHFTTGWLGSKNMSVNNLPVLAATAIEDLGFQTEDDGRRVPEATTEVDVRLPTTMLHIACDGPIRRMQYFPDGGKFEVFEDGMDFTISTDAGKGVKGKGTRQSAFRVGEYMPKKEVVGSLFFFFQSVKTNTFR